MSCGNSRNSKCNPCGPSEAALNSIADRAAYYARIAITASETGGGIRWGYIGDGVETTFNIDGAASTNSASFLVTIDGVVQDPLDYTITFGVPYTITMNNPVPSGDEIVIVSLNGKTGATVPNGTGTVQGVTADFSALYAILGTTYGAAGTLPDLEGVFIRGTGSQTISGITYSGTLGTKQGDAIQGHRHSATPTNVVINTGGSSFTGGGACNVSSVVVGDPTTDGTNGTPRTGAETRPANIALLPCIKY